MAWKAVGPVVKKVVSRIVDAGEMGVSAPSQPEKKTDSAKLPASLTR